MNFTLKGFLRSYGQNWTKIIGNFDLGILKEKRTWNKIFLLAAIMIATTLIIDCVFNAGFVYGITSLTDLLLTIFTVPYIEEVVFRGCVLGVLLFSLDYGNRFRISHGKKAYYLALVVLLMIQAWFFALSHDRIFLAKLDIFISGICLGFAYWHFKKNLVPPIVLHSLINFLLFLIYAR